MRLQVALRHAGERDAVVVAEFDDRIAMRVCTDQCRQLLNILNVGEMVELDGSRLRVGASDRVRADPGMEHERVVAGAADRDRRGRAGRAARR